jgi:hypothetical protein
MRLRLLACEVLTREVGAALAQCPHAVDVEFTPKGAHADVRALRALLQARIDALESGATRYDAVLLGFGLCGNATLDLEARSIPIVIPRAHDCCTLFLGSRTAFQRHFGDNPSRPFHATGYSERDGADRADAFGTGLLPPHITWDSLVEKYGEEDARELVETLSTATAHDEPVEYFIDVPETHEPLVLERCRQDAARRGRDLRVVPGDMRLVRDLLHGSWDHEDYLVIAPGERLAAVYDWVEIMRARRAPEKG